MTNHERMEAAYLAPPEDTRHIMHTCECCGEDILEGDDYYEINGEVYCESCVREGHKTA